MNTFLVSFDFPFVGCFSIRPKLKSGDQVSNARVHI